MVGWFLDSPSHWSTQILLLPTSSMTFWSSVERAKFGVQSRKIPLWDGLNLSSSLVLDAADGHLGPLPLSTFALPPFSLVFVSQCLVLHLGFALTNYHLCILSLFMPFSHSSQYLFSSSFASIDSPSTAMLRVPYSVSL